MNSIFTIKAERKGPMWVFTDPNVGLVDEPFVAGADTLIELLSEGSDEVYLTFSAVDFPSHTLHISRTGGEVTTGTYYHCPQLGMDLWLCPALGKYFDASPDNIYVQFRVPTLKEKVKDIHEQHYN